MKYVNAADVLPEQLLCEVQKHLSGVLLYIPNGRQPRCWGEKNGARSYFAARNEAIQLQFRAGCPLAQLAERYGLAYDTIRKIAYGKRRAVEGPEAKDRP